jgi:glutaconate CoA-transferase subunit A
LPKRSPNVYRGVTDPFTGEHVTVVPPLRIDVAVLYVSAADAFGNARHDGFTFWDELIAQAADRVILVCEELISNDEIRADPRRTTLPGYLVESVTASPGASYPCGTSPLRDADLAHLERYCAAARDADGLTRYLAEIRSSTETEYWRRHNIKEPA